MSRTPNERGVPFIKEEGEIWFPPPAEAKPSGLLAIGGELSSERLLFAYRHGIFPWGALLPALPMWYSPDPRMVLVPGAARVSRRLARTLRQRRFHLSLDRAFGQVIRACANTPRAGQDAGTWIDAHMIRAYEKLHAEGYAHSCEVWADAARQRLVGGLYGISLGRAFFGESMFHKERDASKVAFITLQQQLAAWRFELFDCQLPTPHLASLGARAIPRANFLTQLQKACQQKTKQGPWTLELPVSACAKARA